MVFTLNARIRRHSARRFAAAQGAMDPSRGVQRPHDGDIAWLREASTTALGTDASSPSALEGLPASFLAVFITEIGDKTFFLSAIIAMREGRSVAFAGDAHTQKRTHTITDPQKGVAHGRDPVSTGTPVASP